MTFPPLNLVLGLNSQLPGLQQHLTHLLTPPSENHSPPLAPRHHPRLLLLSYGCSFSVAHGGSSSFPRPTSYGWCPQAPSSALPCFPGPGAAIHSHVLKIHGMLLSRQASPVGSRLLDAAAVPHPHGSLNMSRAKLRSVPQSCFSHRRPRLH